MLIIGDNVKVWVEHCSSRVMTSCTLCCWASFSFSVIVIVVSGFILRAGTDRCSFVELVEVVLVDGPCELDVDPEWRCDTGTGG